jgi:hypothetical protein
MLIIVTAGAEGAGFILPPKRKSEYAEESVKGALSLSRGNY